MAAVAQNTWVEELCLDGCSLQEVEPGVVSSAVSKLAKVKLVNLIFSEEQLAALFSSTASNCILSTLAPFFSRPALNKSLGSENLNLLCCILNAVFCI